MPSQKTANQNARERTTKQNAAQHMSLQMSSLSSSFFSKSKSYKFSGIVPFVTMPLKGRFVVFSQQLLIGYFRLGNWPRRVRALRRG